MVVLSYTLLCNHKGLKNYTGVVLNKNYCNIDFPRECLLLNYNIIIVIKHIKVGFKKRASTNNYIKGSISVVIDLSKKKTTSFFLILTTVNKARSK